MYINYSHKVFATLQFTDFEFQNISVPEAINNVYVSSELNKPRKGRMIWASTFVDHPEYRNETHWTLWLSSEMPEWLENKKLFSFKLKPNAKILIIDKELILHKFYKLLPYLSLVEYMPELKEYRLNFKKIIRNYDGIFVSQNVINNDFKFDNIGFCLEWDVETLLVWNMSIICPWDAERIGYYPLEFEPITEPVIPKVVESSLCPIDYLDDIDQKYRYIKHILVRRTKFKKRITKREQQLIYNLLERGCSIKTVICLLGNKILFALELGMEKQPYCYDTRYNAEIRHLVELSQATMFLYDYFCLSRI